VSANLKTEFVKPVKTTMAQQYEKQITMIHE
jgi:hypothetical protein